MPGIYVMAIITLLASAGLWGGLMYVMSGRNRRYLWLLLPGLPLSALVNVWIKRPLMVGVGQAAGIPPNMGLQTPLWFILFTFTLAPVFEEAIKVLPLLLPWVRRLLSGPATALWVGMGLGISFGLGEAAFLAYGVAQQPAYAQLPWYVFTGYSSERLLVCFVHGVMTAVLVTGLQRSAGRGVVGYLAAAGLHALLNSGALLFQLGLISSWAAQLALVVSLIVLVVIFERLRRNAVRQAEATHPPEEEVVYFRRA